MLKILFWILLLGNGALYAYQQGHLNAWLGSNHEPARLAHQINADKIRLLPAASGSKADNPPAASPANNPVPPPPANGSSKAAEPVLAAASTALPAVAAKKAEADSPPEVYACTEIGNFSEADASRFEKQLTALALGKRLSRRVVQEPSGYMVWIPPQGTREYADKKAGELRQLGITEFYVIQDASEFRWGISLGIFSTEAAAKSRLAQLMLQGVRSARVITRSTISKVTFQLRDLDGAARESVNKIKMLYPLQQMRNCA